MPTHPLLDALRARVLLGDGAMGTRLHAAGLAAASCGEAWNLTHPERILALHRADAAAGADCLLTNTFGATRIRLSSHGYGDDTRAINLAGARLAREALDSRPALDSRGALDSRPGFVLGDLGPFGGRLLPRGDATPARVRAAFEEQAAALLEGGVDALLIETQTSLDELVLAIAAARAAGAPCVLASLAYNVTPDGRDLRTLAGIAPEDGARAARDAGADVVGLNCGAGVDMAWAARVLDRYRNTVELPVLARINAGQPQRYGGAVIYPETPAAMAGGLAAVVAAGARMVGGCCGTTSAHIAALRAVLG